jgi:glycosyltransferase involved in cell wall biosynthesis
MSERLRVLLSAYACEPGKGSEPGVGWNWVLQSARFHDVWVLTRANNRPAIEAALRREPLPNVHFVYHDLPGWARFWKRGQRGVRAYYSLWQLTAASLCRRLHGEIQFDVAHHVTLVNYWMPSCLDGLPVPFIWGPVGGGEAFPLEFWNWLGLRGKLYEAARTAVRAVGERGPFVRKTARRCAVALATTQETASRIARLGCGNVRLVSEAGLPETEIWRLATLPPSTAAPFRLLSLGRLIHWKGFELSLRAFAAFRVSNPSAQYWIAGHGPERGKLELIAAAHGLGNSIRFLGQLTRAEVLDTLGRSDVLVHPSLHDSGGWVCLEAMAAGRPVVCLKLGGPAIQVTDETGIRVKAESVNGAIEGLALAFHRLASNPALRISMGAAGRKRVANEFAWDRKGERFAALYREVITAQADSAEPAFAFARGGGSF